MSASAEGDGRPAVVGDPAVLSGIAGLARGDGEIVNAFQRRMVSDAWERDNGVCVNCGRPGCDVHHIIRRSVDLKTWQPRNLITLCRDCHDRAHSAYARGLLLETMAERYGYTYEDEPFVGYVRMRQAAAA